MPRIYSYLGAMTLIPNGIVSEVEGVIESAPPLVLHGPDPSHDN